MVTHRKLRWLLKLRAVLLLKLVVTNLRLDKEVAEGGGLQESIGDWSGAA